MKKMRDKSKLVNIPFLRVVFFVPNEQYDELVGRIKQLNDCNNLTCGVFKFVPRKKFMRGSSALPPALDRFIGDNNMFVRLLNKTGEAFRYGYDNVDFTADADIVEAEIARVIQEICKDTLAIIDKRLAGYAESPLENKKKIEDLAQLKKDFSFYSDQVGLERGVYKEILSATYSLRVKIYLKNIEIMYYKKLTMRYGVEISVNGAKVPIFLGDKTQTLLYIAALIRFKMQQPLYLHELYRNSNGSRSVYKREKTYKWLEQIFYAIFGKTSIFDEWANPKRGNQSQPRTGHDFHQAKCAILSKFKEALSDHLASALDCCILQTADDEKGDSFYSFNCRPEDIILDETAENLKRAFENIYK